MAILNHLREVEQDEKNRQQYGNQHQQSQRNQMLFKTSGCKDNRYNTAHKRNDMNGCDVL